MAPERLYSAAGDGYLDSFDYGESWKRPMAGLKHEYLVGLAVDPADPTKPLLYLLPDRRGRAHSRDDANSLLYRRSANNREEWKAISKGLPEP